MTDWPIGPGDLAVLIVLFLSALFAFLRGFVREFLGVLGWIGAALVTIFAFPVVAPEVRLLLGMELIADLGTGLVLFIGSLAIFSVLAHFASKGIRGTSLSAVDRSLGILFGLARGALLVSLGYLVFIYIDDDGVLPGWITESRSRPLVAQGATLLVGLVPESTFGSSAQYQELIRRMEGAGQPPNLQDISQPQPAPSPNGDESNGSSGYTEEQQGDLQRLLNTTEQ
ncbi:MAG: CvpA family protein [Azospirillaceae bacterium]